MKYMEISFHANNYTRLYNRGTTANTSKQSFNELGVLGPSAPDEVKEAWKKAE